MIAAPLLFLIALAASSPSLVARAATAGAQSQTQAGQTSNLAGSYDISGMIPREGSYRGGARIVNVNGAYGLSWNIIFGNNRDAAYHGIGILDGNLLCVGWTDDAALYGISIYRINGGRLTGRWTLSNMNGALGTEELDGSASLHGAYRIMRGAGANANESYVGTGTITPRGDTYAVRWNLANGQVFYGTGMRRDDLLVVGWGRELNSTAVSIYRTNGTTLEGVWVAANDDRLGTETLSRN